MFFSKINKFFASKRWREMNKRMKRNEKIPNLFSFQNLRDMRCLFLETLG